MSKPYTYKKLKNTWTNDSIRENWFLSYAVRGPMIIPEMGLEQDMPVNHPITGPVREPSPLNVGCKFTKEGCNRLQKI